MAEENVVEIPQEESRNYVIKDGKAYVTLEYEGKMEEFVLKGLSVKELSYSIDEFMTVKSGGSIDIRIGAMIIALLPKSLIKAPFEIKDNNTILNAPGGLALEFVNPIMELNGFKLKKEKK